MSSVNEQTSYRFTVVLTAPNGTESDGTFTLWAESGATDEGVLAVAEAIEKAPWAAGCVADVGIFKIDDVQTAYQRDTTVSPPAFV